VSVDKGEPLAPNFSPSYFFIFFFCRQQLVRSFVYKLIFINTPFACNAEQKE
jgi:hypothetical protein